MVATLIPTLLFLWTLNLLKLKKSFPSVSSLFFCILRGYLDFGEPIDYCVEPWSIALVSLKFSLCQNIEKSWNDLAYFCTCNKRKL